MPWALILLWRLMSALRIHVTMKLRGWPLSARTAGWSAAVPIMPEWIRISFYFGIAQGGTHERLRAESAQFIVSQNTPGIAIGGVSVGEPPDLMIAAVGWSIPYLPPEKPRYLMGVGTPQDILNAVEQGIDMFDCVLPTRLGRNGTLYTTRGRINIKGSRFTEDFGPVDPNCTCSVCQTYSAAYIRHLYKCNEILASRLATYHNLAHYAQLMAGIRAAIEADDFAGFKAKTLAGYEELKNLLDTPKTQ